VSVEDVEQQHGVPGAGPVGVLPGLPAGGDPVVGPVFRRRVENRHRRGRVVDAHRGGEPAVAAADVEHPGGGVGR
jgi:hypothetical protein